jgi:hypothetical protein
MVLNNELSRHRGAETQRERRSLVKFFIREVSHNGGCFATVLA